MSIAQSASAEQRRHCLAAYQYYRLWGHSPQSAWHIVRSFLTGVIKAY